MPGLSFLNGRNIRNSDTHGSQIQSPGGEGVVVGSAKSGVPCGEHTLADNRVGTRARTLQLYKASAQRGLDRLAPAGSTRSQTTAWVHRAPHVGDGAINKMAMMKKGDKCPVPRKAGYPAGSTRSQTTAWVHVHARYNSTRLVRNGAWTDSHLRGAHARRQPRGYTGHLLPFRSV